MGDELERTDITAIEIPEEEMASFESDEPFVRKNGEPEVDESGDESEAQDQDGEEESESGEEGATSEEEASEESEQSGEEEIVYERDGKEYKAEDIGKWYEDHVNKENWQKSNTEKAQQLAKQTKSLKALLEDEEAMEAMDEYYDGKENNPLRGLDLAETKSKAADEGGEESKSDLDNRLEALEQKEAKRDQEAEEKETRKKVSEMVTTELSELESLDKGMKDPKIVQKVIDHAVKHTNDHPDDRPMSIKEAWLETRGKKLLSEKAIKKGAKEGNKSVSGGGKGIKKTGHKTPPKDYDDAEDRAFKAYQEMEE